MRSTSLLFAILLATAPALGGCLGFGGDEDGDTVGPTGEDGNESTNETSDDNGTSQPPGEGNESGANATEDDGSEEDRRRWTYDNRTGTVSETNAVVASSGSETEDFTVRPNALALELNLSAEGGELEMCIRQPGGNDSEESSCDETVTTEDGNASFRASMPQDGDWTAELQPAEPGQHSIDYELVVAQLVSEEGR